MLYCNKGDYAIIRGNYYKSMKDELVKIMRKSSISMSVVKVKVLKNNSARYIYKSELEDDLEFSDKFRAKIEEYANNEI